MRGIARFLATSAVLVLAVCGTERCGAQPSPPGRLDVGRDASAMASDYYYYQPPADEGESTDGEGEPQDDDADAERDRQPPRQRSSRRTRPPAMIGDFFGSVGAGQTIITNFVDRTVHHTTSINDFHAIIEGGPTAVFVGGPNAGRFYLGTPPVAAPAPETVSGLTRQDGVEGFVGVQTGDTVTILPADDNGFGLMDVPVYAVGLPEVIEIPSPGASGAVVGRTKIAENASPLPEDRVFFNYSIFDDVPLAPRGVTVNRFTPGFEKTLFSGLASVQMGFPFAATLDSTILSDGTTSTGQGEFGNISLLGKLLLTRSREAALSIGLQVTIPTADDLRVVTSSGRELVRIENESVHLMPFLGFLYEPNERTFINGFVQYDFDTNGSPVAANARGMGLEPIGRLNDAAFLYADLGLGRWVYRAPSPSAYVRGVAARLELHYNQSLSTTDVVSSGGFRIGSIANDISTLNLVVGGTWEIGRSSALTVGYAIPIAGGLDEQFDNEVRIFFNRYFGQRQ